MDAWSHGTESVYLGMGCGLDWTSALVFLWCIALLQLHVCGLWPCLSANPLPFLPLICGDPLTYAFWQNFQFQMGQSWFGTLRTCKKALLGMSPFKPTDDSVAGCCCTAVWKEQRRRWVTEWWWRRRSTLICRSNGMLSRSSWSLVHRSASVLFPVNFLICCHLFLCQLRYSGILSHFAELSDMGMRVVTFDEFVNLSIADSSDSLVRKRPKNECSFLIKNNMYNLYFLFYKKRSNSWCMCPRFILMHCGLSSKQTWYVMYAVRWHIAMLEWIGHHRLCFRMHQNSCSRLAYHRGSQSVPL